MLCSLFFFLKGNAQLLEALIEEGLSNNPEIQINVPQNSTTVADNDGSILEHISKYLKQVARIFYRFLFYMICILLVLTGLFLLYLMIVALMEQMGVNLDALPV